MKACAVIAFALLTIPWITVWSIVCLTVPNASAAIGVTGRVLDENGAPVPNARISVSGTDVSPGSNPTTTSDAAGVFRLELSASGDFQIVAERAGFFLFTKRGQLLEDSSALEIRMNHLKELAETVDVSYSAPVIDPRQTSDTRLINGPEILNIPYSNSQDYRAALPLMSGAIQDNRGQVHFNGGNANETSYRLNGFEVSDPATGNLTARLNVDTVQTLEWNASRFSPDQGKGSAGVLEIKTEMGDNHWRFGGTNFVPGFGAQDGIHLDHWSPRLKLSGPILHDRLWFHTAFDTFYAVNTVSSLPKGENRTQSLSGSTLTRLQWNVTRAHILTVSFLGNRADDHRNGLSLLSPLETTLNRRQSLLLGTVKDQWMVGGGLIEFGFADTTHHLRSSPRGDVAYVVTAFGSRGNFFTDRAVTSGRQEMLVNAFARPLHRAGEHHFQTGFDLERLSLDQTIQRHDYAAVRADDSLVRTVQFFGGPRQFKNTMEASTYAMDRWNPREGLSIEAGLRFQWDQYTRGAPPAPRLSAAWSPRHTGGTRLAAGWGIFYDAINLNTLALSQEQSSLSTFYAPDGLQRGVPVLARFVLRPRDLRLPRFTLASLSLDRKLPWQVYGRVNLTSREGRHGFSFENLMTDPTQNIYQLGNIQRQRYHAVEVAARRTFLSRYEWFASYTRSEASASAVINYSVENPIFAPQASGRLPWDTPNRFLAWGWVPVEKRWFPRFLRPLVGETDLQLLADYRTGFPFSVQGETGNLVGPPNARRFPVFGTVNVALERRFPFRGYLWAWRVGLINAMDRANPNVVNNDIDSPRFLTYARGQRRSVNVRLRFLGKK